MQVEGTGREYPPETEQVMSKVLRMTVLGGLLCVTAGVYAQPSHAQLLYGRSYCLGGNADFRSWCGFATIEQCLLNGAGYGVCNESPSAPHPYFMGENGFAHVMAMMPAGKMPAFNAAYGMRR